MTKKTFIPILLIITFILFSAEDTLASGYGLSITPPLLRVHIKPGKSISQVFKIENFSQSDIDLVARVIPFSEADDKGNPVLNPKTTASWLSYFSLANSQIKFNEPFSVKAGSSEQLILSLTVPEDAPLKDIYATLMISTYQNTVRPDLQGTSVSAAIGSNMLITISSVAYPDTVLKIEDFLPKQGSYIKIGNLYLADNISPISFSATVKNEGDFTAETKGVFRVSSGQDQPVFLDGILPVNVIGKSKRQLININGSAFEFIPSLNQIGFHKISLEIKTDNSNTASTLDFFFFPLKLTLGLLISVVVVISAIKITSRTPNTPIDNPHDK